MIRPLNKHHNRIRYYFKLYLHGYEGRKEREREREKERVRERERKKEKKKERKKNRVCDSVSTVYVTTDFPFLHNMAYECESNDAYRQRKI